MAQILARLLDGELRPGRGREWRIKYYPELDRFRGVPFWYTRYLAEGAEVTSILGVIGTPNVHRASFDGSSTYDEKEQKVYAPWCAGVLYTNNITLMHWLSALRSLTNRRAWQVRLESSRARKAAGLDLIPTSCVRLKRRIYRPFDTPVLMAASTDSVVDVPSWFAVGSLLGLLFALPAHGDLLQQGDRVENREIGIPLVKLLVLHQVEKVVISTDEIASPSGDCEVDIGLILGIVRYLDRPWHVADHDRFALDV